MRFFLITILTLLATKGFAIDKTPSKLLIKSCERSNPNRGTLSKLDLFVMDGSENYSLHLYDTEATNFLLANNENKTIYLYELTPSNLDESFTKQTAQGLFTFDFDNIAKLAVVSYYPNSCKTAEGNFHCKREFTLGSCVSW